MAGEREERGAAAIRRRARDRKRRKEEVKERFHLNGLAESKRQNVNTVKLMTAKSNRTTTNNFASITEAIAESSSIINLAAEMSTTPSPRSHSYQPVTLCVCVCMFKADNTHTNTH